MGLPGLRLPPGSGALPCTLTSRRASLPAAGPLPAWGSHGDAGRGGVRPPRLPCGFGPPHLSTAGSRFGAPASRARLAFPAGRVDGRSARRLRAADRGPRWGSVGDWPLAIAARTIAFGGRPPRVAAFRRDPRGASPSSDAHVAGPRGSSDPSEASAADDVPGRSAEATGPAIAPRTSRADGSGVAGDGAAEPGSGMGPPPSREITSQGSDPPPLRDGSPVRTASAGVWALALPGRRRPRPSRQLPG